MFIIHMRLSGNIRVGSQTGPKKTSLERVGRGSCSRVLWWLPNGAGMKFPRHGHEQRVAWFELPTSAKGEWTHVFLPVCPDWEWKGRGAWQGLKTVQSQTTQWSQTLLYKWSRYSWKDCSWSQLRKCRREKQMPQIWIAAYWETVSYVTFTWPHGNYSAHCHL